MMCINIYDIRLEDTAPACGMNWPPEMPAIKKMLGVKWFIYLFHRLFAADLNLDQRPEVVNALHATAHPGGWVECRSSVHRAFHEKDQESSISVLPRVLSKIPTLLFVGDQDLICNYIGIENMINALIWNGGTGLGVCYFVSLPSSAILTVSSDCTDTIMECQLVTCRHLGNLKKFDIRQGIYLHEIHSNPLLNMSRTPKDL